MDEDLYGKIIITTLQTRKKQIVYQTGGNLRDKFADYNTKVSL